jgi:hypothetical protein
LKQEVLLHQLILHRQVLYCSTPTPTPLQDSVVHGLEHIWTADAY